MNRIILALFCFISIIAKSQNNTVTAGEKLVYTASYNMSGVPTDIAQVTMETSEIKTSKATLLRLKCTAATFSKWDSFFKIRDLYESYVSPKSLKPYLYKRNINEGSYFKAMKYTFSSKSNIVKTIQTKKKKDGDTWDENKDITINTGTKDIVSTLYNIRTLDYKNMSNRTTNVATIIFDREEVKTHITYLGKETIQTNIGNKECFKLAISTSKSDVLRGNSNLIWLSADENKIPVYVRFKIPVGNGELKINSASGLRN